MDFDILGCSFHMASTLEIPSFEEAFDTESLRRFYGIQAPSVTLTKSAQNLPVEEDAWFQNLDFLSPSPSKNDSQYFFDFPIENKEATDKRELKTNKNGEQTSDMIASICQQIQQFYQPEGNSTLGMKKQAEEALGSSILKKLIRKEEVFIIHKRKNKTKSPPSSNRSPNGSPLLQKNLSINLSTKSVSDCETNYTNDIVEKPKSSQKVVFGGLVTDVKNLIPRPKQYFF